MDSHIEIADTGRCAFCAYLAGDRPYTILWRRPLVAAVVTREQRGIGHVLVLPTRHVPTILDLDDAEAAELMQGLRGVASQIDRAYERPGIAIWQNNGTAARQTIPHVHFHVAGTLEEGGTDWGEVREISVAETDAIADRLRAAVPGS